MHLEALLAALRELLERLQGRESARGELEEAQGKSRRDQAAARGGIREGYTPSLRPKGIRV